MFLLSYPSIPAALRLSFLFASCSSLPVDIPALGSQDPSIRRYQWSCSIYPLSSPCADIGPIHKSVWGKQVYKGSLTTMPFRQRQPSSCEHTITQLHDKRKRRLLLKRAHDIDHVPLPRPRHHRRSGICPSESSSVHNVKCCLCPYWSPHRWRLLWALPPQGSFLTPKSK